MPLLNLELSGCLISHIMFSFFIFIFGLAVGSFLNVIICRLETNEPILISRSHCPKCRAVLKWFNLIPVLSFTFQKGRCRCCGERISWQYPLVEIGTGLLFLLIFNFQFSPFYFTQGKIFNEFSIFKFFNIFYYLFIVSFLVIIFVYDLKHYLIPDKIIYPAILVSGIWLVFNEVLPEVPSGVLPLGRDNGLALRGGLLAALIAGGFFIFLVLISKGRWMGLGDVKLGILMGLVLGWPNVLSSLFLAFLSGAIVGLGLIIVQKKTMKSQIG